MVRSVRDATSLADEATSAFSPAVFDASMSCTTSGVPAPIRLRAMRLPMAPKPMKPTLPAIPSSRGLWWGL